MAPKSTRVIAMAASKGGTGKSTLTAVLAIQAVKEGARVALVDAEPQQSLTTWWRLRGKPGNPSLHAYSGDPVADADALRADGGCSYVFIDTMPAEMSHMERAIEAADFVIIPTRVGAFDLLATSAVVGFCRIHKKPHAFLLNETDPKWESGVASAVRQLKKIGPVLPKSIRHRAVYAQALTTGKTGPEMKGAKEAGTSATEIRAVWTAVKNMMGVSR